MKPGITNKIGSRCPVIVKYPVDLQKLKYTSSTIKSLMSQTERNAIPSNRPTRKTQSSRNNFVKSSNMAMLQADNLTEDQKSTFRRTSAEQYWRKQPTYKFVQNLPKVMKKRIKPLTKLRTKRLHRTLFQIRQEKAIMDDKINQLENENMNFTDAVLTGLLQSGNLNHFLNASVKEAIHKSKSDLDRQKQQKKQTQQLIEEVDDEEEDEILFDEKQLPNYKSTKSRQTDGQIFSSLEQIEENPPTPSPKRKTKKKKKQKKKLIRVSKGVGSPRQQSPKYQQQQQFYNPEMSQASYISEKSQQEIFQQLMQRKRPQTAHTYFGRHKNKRKKKTKSIYCQPRFKSRPQTSKRRGKRRDYPNFFCFGHSVHIIPNRKQHGFQKQQGMQTGRTRNNNRPMSAVTLNRLQMKQFNNVSNRNNQNIKVEELIHDNIYGSNQGPESPQTNNLIFQPDIISPQQSSKYKYVSRPVSAVKRLRPKTAKTRPQTAKKRNKQTISQYSSNLQNQATPSPQLQIQSQMQQSEQNRTLTQQVQQSVISIDQAYFNEYTEKDNVPVQQKYYTKIPAKSAKPRLMTLDLNANLKF